MLGAAERVLRRRARQLTSVHNCAHMCRVWTAVAARWSASAARPFSAERIESGFGKLPRALFGLVRLLAFLAAFQLTGAHDAIALVVAGSDECCADCPIQQTGKPCPPGCPSCHCCVPVKLALPAAGGEVIGSHGPADVQLVFVPYAAALAQAPPLPGIYRPPRDS